MLITMSHDHTAVDLRDKYLGRSCERHFVYAHVRSDRCSRRWPVSWQNIDDSRWKPGLSKQCERKRALLRSQAKLEAVWGNPDSTQHPYQQRRETTSKRRRTDRQTEDGEDVNMNMDVTLFTSCLTRLSPHCNIHDTVSMGRSTRTGSVYQLIFNCFVQFSLKMFNIVDQGESVGFLVTSRPEAVVGYSSRLTT